MNSKLYLILGIGLVVLTSFMIDIDPVPQSSYTPLLLSRDDLEASITLMPSRDFETPGKIYLYGNTILVTEQYKGIHVIDNSNPASPVATGFIHIPGCMDVSVKESVLYADNATDLLSIQLNSNPLSISVIDRVRDVFPEPTPPDLEFIPAEFSSKMRPKNTVIVGWKLIN